MTIHVPIPTRLVTLCRADGRPVNIAAGATGAITFQRVAHPVAKLREVPDDTPEMIRIEHRFSDLAGEPLIFISHVPAEFLWEQLYLREAYVDYQAMLEREMPATVAPWQETLLLPALRGSNDSREFRAFRVHRPEVSGHPDVVPVFSKCLRWTARVSWVTAALEPSIGGMAHAFALTFTDTREFTALRDVSLDGNGFTWKEFDLNAPFHVCVRAFDLLWHSFDEPDANQNWWRLAPRPILCVSADT